MSTQGQPKEEKGTPWWVVFLVFVVLPVTVAFFISRHAAAQLIRRKAIASAHGWAIEVKGEGQRSWVLHGFHRDLEFEAVHLLREGGGTAWRLRMGTGRSFGSWLLVSASGMGWRARDFGTISTLVVREALPPKQATPANLGALEVYGDAVELLALDPLVAQLATLERLPTPVAVSLVDDGVVIDGLGDLPEGEALLPYLDFVAGTVRLFAPDAG